MSYIKELKNKSNQYNESIVKKIRELMSIDMSINELFNPSSDWDDGLFIHHVLNTSDINDVNMYELLSQEELDYLIINTDPNTINTDHESTLSLLLLNIEYSDFKINQEVFNWVVDNTDANMEIFDGIAIYSLINKLIETSEFEKPHPKGRGFL